jgi:adenylate kinase
MKIVLLGCPGAGKGTQANVLSQKYGLTHLSTGDIFRAEIDKKTAMGEKVQNYVKKGLLVPDELVVEIVAGRVDATPCLFDGFPRTLPQAQELERVLQRDGMKIDLVLYLAMKEDEVIRRLTARRTCSKCGAVYNLNSKPPAVEGKCDSCEGDVVQREDDSEATVKKRLMVYQDQTEPLIAYYKAAGDFHEVDGGQAPEVVSEALGGIIDQLAAAKSGT